MSLLEVRLKCESYQFLSMLGVEGGRRGRRQLYLSEQYRTVPSGTRISESHIVLRIVISVLTLVI